MARTAPPALRLAELLGALSLATDLGVGAPLETSLRTCLLATTVGEHLGLPAPELAAVYYASLLRHLGCTAWAHEAAALTGDDHDLLRTFEGVDRGSRLELVGQAVRRLGASKPVGQRARAVTRVLTRPAAGDALTEAQCAQAEALAGDLGLGAEVVAALGQMYERHDGGGPRRLRKEALSRAGQLVHLAQTCEALVRQVGARRALAELARRSGRQLAPELVQAALDCEPALAELADPELAERVLAAEPSPTRQVAGDALPEVALAFARFADLKSPHRVGHSPQVARLALAAGARAGLSDDERRRLHVAALLHDLGAVSVGNAVWDHPRPLGAAGREHLHLHAHWGERILARCPLTRPYAALVGAHHERLDGSGYHRNARGDSLDRLARLLAAADCWVGLTSARPHRPAASAAEAARVLTEEAAAGRLCRDATAHVLTAAGQPPQRAALPAGLTEREAEVLRHLARGLVSKEIAAVLGIATRTVKHHIEHIYEKTGVSTRAAAALFAARNDLIAPGD